MMLVLKNTKVKSIYKLQGIEVDCRKEYFE